MDFAGNWRKISSQLCDQPYPDELEFQEATYLGRKGAEQRFVLWDAGIYEIVEPDQVRISIATDELVLYRFSLTDDLLTFEDAKGCAFGYRRVD
jgi:hypothetical protein